RAGWRRSRPPGRGSWSWWRGARRRPRPPRRPGAPGPPGPGPGGRGRTARPAGSILQGSQARSWLRLVQGHGADPAVLDLEADTQLVVPAHFDGAGPAVFAVGAEVGLLVVQVVVQLVDPTDLVLHRHPTDRPGALCGRDQSDNPVLVKQHQD